MAYSKADLIRIEEQLSGAYHEAEKTLLRILSQVELSDWQATRAAQQLAEVQGVLNQLGEHTTQWANTHVPALYLEGLNSADEVLDAARVGLERPETFARLHVESIQMLGENIVLRYDQALNVVGRQAQDFFREAGLKALQQTTALGGDRRQATRTMVAMLREKGITSFVDRSGNEWSLGRYAEMVARTTSRECTNLGLENRLRERGHDLVEITSHGGACPKCTPWEGKVLSISGATEGYPTVDEAKADGLFHPNCVHVEVPWIEGYSEGMSDADRAQLAELNAKLAAEQKARAVRQRRTRQHKLSQEALAQVRPEVAAWAKDLTGAEREAFHAWSTEMNRCRRIRQIDRGDAIVDEEARRWHRNMMQALDRAPRHQGMVYRGLTGLSDDVMAEFASLEAGDVMTLDSVQSASQLEDVAQKFARSGAGTVRNTTRQGVLLEVESLSSVDITPLSGYTSQQEVLMLRDTRLEIVGSEMQELAGGRKLLRVRAREIVVEGGAR